jgi:hypothetical protein
MRRIALILLALLVAAPALPASAQDIHRLMAQVPLLPLSEGGDHSDIEQLVRTYWPDFFNAGGEHGFARDQLRVGRIDLDGDDRAELFVMIHAPAWESSNGFPLVVARWTGKGWVPAGWAWGDPDSVFVTAERLEGWATIDTPNHWLRWSGGEYRLTDKPR